MKQIKISQSLVKDYDSFIKEDLCGFEFESKYITGEWDRTWNDSDSKALGRYFEYILTGAMPTGYNEYPKAKYLATVQKKLDKDSSFIPDVKDMLSQYRFAHEQAVKARKLIDKSGIKIESSQVYRTKGIMTGNIDVEATLNGDNVNIDIKYSGMIYNRWEKFGWMWTPVQMNYNGIQAKHYQILNGRPTYFLVVSSDSKKPVIKFFKAEIDPFDLEIYEAYCDSLPEKIETISEVGWVNFPSLEKCEGCPLKSKCPDKIDKLIPEVIYIQSN